MTHSYRIIVFSPHSALADVLPIGHSTPGWCFALNRYPADGIVVLADWRRIFALPYVVILDERDRVITADAMLRFITQRVPRGNSRQLRRHHIKWDKCVSHGEGTWDYFDAVRPTY